MHDEALPLTDLGSYRLETLLGRGGMGAVYRAMDERLQRSVAVKHLPPAAAGSEERRQRFRREALALARLSHPAIVQIFDLVDSADGDWIVMELVQGPTLGTLLEDGPLPLPQVLEMGRQVAEGLAEAHDQGILHRDLKADNVMLHRSGHAKILDFGLAKGLEDHLDDASLSGSGQILGTIHAMSPEQARGLNLDARSDLFSLGVLLYEMTTGERPFKASTPLATLQQIIQEPHGTVSAHRVEAPGSLSKLIDRLLEKSPQHRPSSARSVALELAAIASDSRGVEDVETLIGGPKPSSLDSTTRTPVSAPTEAHTDSATTAGSGSIILGSFDGTPSEVRPPSTVETGGLILAPAHIRTWAPILIVVVAMALGISQWRRGLDPAMDIEAQPTEATETTGAKDAYTLLQRGMGYLDRIDKPGHAEKAIAAFEAVLAQDGNSAPAHAGLALAYWRQYLDGWDPLKLEQAQSVARRAVQLDEHVALTRIAHGTVLAEAGDHEEAVRELEAALQLSPGNADAHLGLGIAHLKQGEHARALEAFEKAIAGKPQDPHLRDQLGTQYYRQGRYPEAEEQFSTSIDLAPDRVYGYRNLSAVYYIQGRLPEAADILQKALLIQPEHSLYSNLGTILFAQGLYLPAAKAFQKALDHGGANIYLYWANLADAYRQAEGYGEEARAAYGQAIRLLENSSETQPDHQSTASRLALYFAKAGDCTRSVAALGSDDPLSGDPMGHYRKAVSHEICGRREAALVELSEALRAGFPETELARDPDLFELRSDPGYHELIAKIGAAHSPQ